MCWKLYYMSSLPEEGSLLKAPHPPWGLKWLNVCTGMQSSRSTLLPHHLLQRDFYFILYDFLFFFCFFENQTPQEMVTFDLWAPPPNPILLSPARRAPGVCFWTGVPPPPSRQAPLLNQLSLPVSKPEFREKPKGTEPFTNCLQTVSKGVVAVQCK